jgi:hypothetical protein
MALVTEPAADPLAAALPSRFCQRAQRAVPAEKAQALAV